MDGADPSPRRRRAIALAAAAVAGLVAITVVLLVSGGSSRHAGAPGAEGSASASTGATGPASSGATATASPSPGATETAPPSSGATGPAPAGLPAQPRPSGAEQFGASVNRLFNDRTYTPAEIDSQLQQLQRTGATIARSDALWEATEPTAPVDGVHHYDWSFDDLIAESLAAHRLRWLPILDYSAGWAQSVPGQDHSPPQRPSDFGAFAHAFAARYGSAGAFWRAHPNFPSEPVDTYEIWNEPDNAEFWVPTPDAARYVVLHLSARDAIKAVDPEASVIVGGLSHPEAFLPEMLRARPDLAGQIDGVAIHPYGPTPRAVLNRVETARQTLNSLGLQNVPLYVTEFGWTTHPPGALSYLPERLRPGYIESTLAALGHTNCGVAAAVLYTWVTPDRDPQDHEDWFGISPPEGGPSADTQLFAAGVHAASATGSTIRLCG